MACVGPCSCCKGACCVDDNLGGYTCTQETCADCETLGGAWQGPGTTCPDGVTCPCDPPANQAYCERCEAGSVVDACVDPQFCDGSGSCVDPTCNDCYKDCIATNDGDVSTSSCFGPPDADPGLFWTRTVFGVDYKIYLWAGRTFGDPANNCSGITLASRVYDSNSGAEITYNYPDAVAVFSGDGCLESITPGDPVQEDVTSICGALTTWAGCIDGYFGTMALCTDFTPDTPGPIEFACATIACDGMSPCAYGNCCDDGLGGGICQPGECNPFP